MGLKTLDLDGRTLIGGGFLFTQRFGLDKGASLVVGSRNNAKGQRIGLDKGG